MGPQEARVKLALKNLLDICKKENIDVVEANDIQHENLPSIVFDETQFDKIEVYGKKYGPLYLIKDDDGFEAFVVANNRLYVWSIISEQPELPRRKMVRDSVTGDIVLAPYKPSNSEFENFSSGDLTKQQKHARDNPDVFKTEWKDKCQGQMGERFYDPDVNKLLFETLEQLGLSRTDVSTFSQVDGLYSIYSELKKEFSMELDEKFNADVYKIGEQVNRWHRNSGINRVTKASLRRFLKEKGYKLSVLQEGELYVVSQIKK